MTSRPSARSESARLTARTGANPARRRLPWWRRLLLAVGLLVVLTTIITAFPLRRGENRAPALPGSDRLTWEVPAPDTSMMEPQVRTLLTEARATFARRPQTGETWGRLGQLYDAHALDAMAEDCYLHATHLAPDDFRWAYHLAMLRDKRHGDSDEIIALFRRAETLVADYPPLPYRLGEALARRGRYGDAIETYDRAITLAPEFGAAHRAKGQALLALGRLDDALTHLQRARELMPEDSVTWSSLARLHMQRGEHDQAEIAAERTKSLQPFDMIYDPIRQEVGRLGADHLALTRRASERIRAGRYAEAAEELRWAIEAGLRNSRVHGQLALCYEVLGDRESALAHLRRAVELNPDDEVLQQQLAALSNDAD